MSTIQDRIFRILAETCGRDASDIQTEEYLGRDLGMSSIQLVQMAAKAQALAPGRVIPFQDLLIIGNGTVKTDIQVAELVSFLQKALA